MIRLFKRKSDQTGAPEVADEARSPTAAASRERRVQARYSMGTHRVATLALPPDYHATQAAVVRDLGYSGFSVFFPDVSAASRAEVLDRGRLEILGQVCEVSMRFVHLGGEVAGFEFRHQSPDTLMFLRPILEAMRWGSTLTPISDAAMKPSDAHGGPGHRAHYRGDGPVDLLVQEGAALTSALTELRLSFPSHERYNEVVVVGDRVETLVSESKRFSGDVAAKMAATVQPDLKALRTAALILLGGLGAKALGNDTREALSTLLVTARKYGSS